MADIDAFMEIAGGDRGLAKLLLESLKKLEDGAGGPVMQEMARDVLAGRIGLREAANSSAYADAFQESMRAFQRWADEVGPEELQRAAEGAEQFTAQLREEIGDTGPGAA
jgi:hypothetical protein